MKKILVALLVLVAAGIAAYFMLNNPMGRLVKLAVEKFGPEMTQAKVVVGKVEIATTDGKGRITNLLLGNPAGFKTDYALKADTVDVELEPASVARKVVVIHKILIDAPAIIYEKGDHGTNFDAIQHNVEKYLRVGDSKEKPAGGSGKKMIIDTFIIRNPKVNYNGTIDLSLPDIELHNIGKKSGGATSAQVTKAIITELNAKLVVALAKTVAIGAVGGVAIGAGMAVKGLLDK
ncbi:MAG: hypothetical protein GC139_06960 [Sideroxydans sp.]|nr:hypothetical protein [Sideroxydans sp.]